jgi:hypothetical protein
MSKFIRSMLVAAAVLTGPAVAFAETVPDQSDQYGGYDPNSQEGNKAFWDQQSRKSGGGGSGR